MRRPHLASQQKRIPLARPPEVGTHMHERIVLIWCGLLAVAVSAAAGQVSATPVRDSATALRFTGCYELQMRPTDSSSVVTRQFSAWPSRMTLTTLPEDNRIPRFGPLRAEPDPWIMPRGGHRFGGSWNPLGSDTLIVGWTDGYSTFGLRLGMHGDTLRGTGELGSDVISPDSPRMRFVAWRVRCSETSTGRAG